MTKVYELGAGVLLFIPTTQGKQLAFQFGQSGEVELHRSGARRATASTVAREVKSAAWAGPDIQPGGCVPGGGFDAWLDECTVRDTSAPSVSSRALYRSYIEHAKANAVPPCCELSLTKFGLLLTGRGFEKFKASNQRVDRRGLRLLRQPEEDGLDRYGDSVVPYTCKRAKAQRGHG